jgi:outer membrane protein OmpA-like peptidoglycan-associated protein
MTPRGAEKKTETKGASFAEEVTAIVREFNDDRIWLDFDKDGRLRLMVSVVFSANSTEFEGLSPEIMASNQRTLKYVSDILKRTKYSSIIIEGHSNPTSPAGPQRDREENELKLLSRLRALTVVDELRQYGVNLDRRSVQGAGSSRLVAPYNDAQNNWKNRRVEFILVQ